nr:immunoglobulin heavy chain junction region [Macaca mulatta]MOX93747.1 immunoglobulin heavy chain junction region [Macaca mulatta]MOX94500.1 immunoglobulin heavy chain junction region [Macaca mulatta]MOX96004.1 immunoglobulin heavy chain junction region [Macaca mulatta]MOX96130.1 immunoglobulin heavy chain junction region [Macaca mulatta]
CARTGGGYSGSWKHWYFDIW